eukprot:UN24445
MLQVVTNERWGVRFIDHRLNGAKEKTFKPINLEIFSLPTTVEGLSAYWSKEFELEILDCKKHPLYSRLFRWGFIRKFRKEKNYPKLINAAQYACKTFSVSNDMLHQIRDDIIEYVGYDKLYLDALINGKSNDWENPLSTKETFTYARNFKIEDKPELRFTFTEQLADLYLKAGQREVALNTYFSVGCVKKTICLLVDSGNLDGLIQVIKR